MITSTDVCVVGSGSGGKMVAQELARAGRRVTLVERGLVGGYCPYLACVPAKSLLLSARAGLSWVAARAVRDEASSHRDDSAAAAELTGDGVEVVRGSARRVGPGRVELDDQVVEAGAVVVATGSSPVRPPLPGLDGAPTWTSEDALACPDLPRRLVVLGGGPVAVELAQAFRGLGSEVALVQRGPHLLSGEPPWVGDVVGAALAGDGVAVHTGDPAAEVVDGQRLRLESGVELPFDRLLLATGRRPVTDGLGLADGWLTDAGALRTDARCRVVDGLYAVGDVTGISPYTHTANHQARTVVAELLGRGRDADYSAVPRAVYTDPTVFCVGATSGARSARFEVGDVERATLVGLSRRRDVTGAVELFADEAGVLVGAACVGPDADSWGAELALAVRARLDVELLRHHVRAFPTWSEAIFPALEELGT
ncbi:FAD-dependent oxidoreductase [Kineococcus aurantiacus]|uniref:Dihydrolipoamide dehydrogenase n=1 Tax=Kineococcus aurantiacus TaxID=37633 RepID=A0A7Y9AUS8_9ACTN|nr:dihydrolipoamide dehydrogenase [Kineococcus aurantiacus]